VNTRVALVLALATAASTYAAIAAPEPPRLLDTRYEIRLFATEPDIVTPIGIAIDARDRLFVLESHTHSAPRDYPGPAGDRILVFTDTDRNGVPDSRTLFAEGFDAGMCLAFGPGGALYLCCAGGVWRMEDTDGDDRADTRREILKLESAESYPHNRLMGLALGPDDRLYVSRGNLAGRQYTLRGTDDSAVQGYGAGGEIVSCRPDGSQLLPFSTGFWNPFALRFDARNNLLLTDNDPDARGPNRLVHAVEGADYGYKSLYGGEGHHPFQAWDGELPGTLPYISATGEAPCDLIDCSTFPAPAHLRDTILVAVWGENTIERHDLRARGLSFEATRTHWAHGGTDFRPVAFAADPHGHLFLTDWVKVAYPNHGHGRIWRIAPRPGVRLEPPAASAARRPANPLAGQSLARLELALRSHDPFARHFAIRALASAGTNAAIATLFSNTDPAVRMGALLAARTIGREEASSRATSEALLKQALRDPDPSIRLAAMLWIGDERLIQFRADLETVLHIPDVSPRLFETYLAAVATLQPAFITAVAARNVARPAQIPRPLPPGFIEQLVINEDLPPQLRAMAMTRLSEARDQSAIAGRLRLLLDLSHASSPALALAAVRGLASIPHANAADRLRSLALDPAAPSALRAEAIAAHAAAFAPPEALLPLLEEHDATLQVEAARALRPYLRNNAIEDAFKARLETLSPDAPAALRSELMFALDRVSPSRPASVEQWAQLLSSGGDSAAGQRVFFSPQTACATCHSVDGRGGRIGPDLGKVAQSLDRRAVVRAIVRPSESFAPQYQAWVVETAEGETWQGLQADLLGDGGVRMLIGTGQWLSFSGRDVQRLYASTNSLMPDGLETALSVEAFRDLVAFLSSRN
jgi:putative membrane-bound dehydrogenase-like protein